MSFLDDYMRRQREDAMSREARLLREQYRDARWAMQNREDLINQYSKQSEPMPLIDLRILLCNLF